MHEIDEEISSS